MYIEGIAGVLHITNKSNTAPLSFSRYLSTLNHTLSWYRGVPELLKSAARVRVLHRQAANMRQDVMVVILTDKEMCVLIFGRRQLTVHDDNDPHALSQELLSV